MRSPTTSSRNERSIGEIPSAWAIEKNSQQDENLSTTLKNLENERQVTKWHFWDRKAAFLRDTTTKRKLNLMLRRKISVDELEPRLRYQKKSSFAVLRRGKSMSWILIEFFSQMTTLCVSYMLKERETSPTARDIIQLQLRYCVKKECKF